MYYISHRGNLNGPNEHLENSPQYIERALQLDLDVEVDVRLIDGEFWLGHDSAEYHTTLSFLSNRRLWIHAKNLEALWAFCAQSPPLNFFWHQNDDATLTSHNWIWTYPGHPLASRSIYVMPEHVPSEQHHRILNACEYEFSGICSDRILAYREDIRTQHK